MDTKMELEQIDDRTVADEQTGEPRDIEVITAEINFYKATAGAAIIEIGSRLIEAKAQLSHGEWTKWLEEKVSFSEVTAQRFMRLAREYPKPSTLTVLGASKALQLLALSPSEREKFIEEKHDVNGQEKTVEEMSTRELRDAIRDRLAAIKERDEALKKLEESRAAEAVATERYEKAKEEAERAIANKKALEVELQELKSRPVEAVYSEPDPGAIEAAKREAAEAAAKEAREKALQELKAKIEKAEAEKKKALEAKAKAEAELLDAIKEQQEHEKERDEEKSQLAGRVAELEKKLAVASSADTAGFKARFEVAQSAINGMLGDINAKLSAGEQEAGMKLGAALARFCQAILSSLPAECVKQ